MTYAGRAEEQENGRGGKSGGPSAAAQFESGERRRGDYECPGPELGRSGGSGERGGDVHCAPLAGMVEAPERERHAQNHGRDEIFDEERAGDQVDQRCCSEERGHKQRRIARQPAPRGAVKHCGDGGEEGEVQQAGRALSTEQIDDRIGEIGGHGHYGPDEEIGPEGEGVMGGDIRGHRQVHGEAIGARFGFQGGEPMYGERQQQERQRAAFTPVRQLDTAKSGGPRAQPRQKGAGVERQRQRKHSGPDGGIVNGRARRERHQQRIDADSEQCVKGFGPWGGGALARHAADACVAQRVGGKQEKEHRPGRGSAFGEHGGCEQRCREYGRVRPRKYQQKGQTPCSEERGEVNEAPPAPGHPHELLEQMGGGETVDGGRKGRQQDNE